MNEQEVPSTELIRGMMFAIGPKALQQFDFWLANHTQRTWHDGFMACANWWEINHAAIVAEDQNPYA